MCLCFDFASDLPWIWIILLLKTSIQLYWQHSMVSMANTKSIVPIFMVENYFKEILEANCWFEGFSPLTYITNTFTHNKHTHAVKRKHILFFQPIITIEHYLYNVVFFAFLWRFFVCCRKLSMSKKIGFRVQLHLFSSRNVSFS